MDCMGWLQSILPHRKIFVDVFGGSASVLLNRPISKLEVYNDLNSDVVNFYRVLRHNPKELIQRLEFTIHSREEWDFCKKTLTMTPDETLDDPIERAARWYYLIQYSFLGGGRHFARIVTVSSAVAGTLNTKLPRFWAIHNRIQRVQFENCHWEEILFDFDSKDTVFYLDPPYYGVDQSAYKCKMRSELEHRQLLKSIYDLKGFVALSGYENNLYAEYNDMWTNIYYFNRKDRASPRGEYSHIREGKQGARQVKREVLWVLDRS